VRPRTIPLLLAVTSVIALAGCAAQPSAESLPAESAVPHGYVEGATEMQEHQLRLVTLDSAGGLTAFDPATEQSIELASTTDVTHLSTDGRYAYLASATSGSLRIIDTGAWTVPHGDHSHYYLAEPRDVGVIDDAAESGDARVSSSVEYTAAFFPASGTTVVLDREALGTSTVTELGRISGSPHAGVAIPLGDFILVSTATGTAGVSSVRVTQPDGTETELSAECVDLSDGAITRVGVIFACRDGALLATLTETGTVSFDRIPYPAGTAPGDIATSFAARPDRPSVAAVAGDRGAWLLNTRALEWSLVPTDEPLLRATAVGDSGDTIVGVAASGSIVVLDKAGVVATTDPVLADDLSGGELPPGIRVEVDIARAYVNSPSAGVVYEIDYADGARIARVLDVAGDASHLVETGR